MFSLRNQKNIEEEFQKVLPYLGNLLEEILQGIEALNEEEALAIKFLYSSMPLSDAFNYSFQLFLEYARHGLFLWKNKSFLEGIPEEIFLNYVLHHRVNNEDIVSCRSFFYEEVDKYIENSTTMEEIILEANYWCQSQVTYKSTDDRTANPMDVYKRSYGRCGEESVFTVNVLRSIGIPARQVYVPRWSHCDDNHAWVEVWSEGSWSYLGACEPEPILNKGWFTNAAARAMLIHSRCFSSIFPGDEVISREGKVTYLNHIRRYAEAKTIEITVVDSNNEPIEDCTIDLQILNETAFHTIASLSTNKEGKASISLGLGSVYIRVLKDNHSEEIVIDNSKEIAIDTSKKSSFIIKLGEDDIFYEDVSIDMLSPVDNPIGNLQLTPEEKSINKERFKKNSQERSFRLLVTFEEARSILQRANYPVSEELREILKESGRNYREIVEFLLESCDEAMEAYKIPLLKAIAVKDYSHCTKDILMEQLAFSMKYKENYPEDIFVEYILNPRVYYEPLTNYRRFFEGVYNEEEKQTFRKNPKLLWTDLDKRIRSEKEYEYDQLVTNPVPCFKSAIASDLSKKILFVTICRSLGIAARLNKKDMSLEYYWDNGFVPVFEQLNKIRSLKINIAPGDSLIYYKDWTLAVLENNSYRTLKLTGIKWEGDTAHILVEKGFYRIITSSRTLKGDLLANMYFVDLRDEDKTLKLEIREAELKDMLQKISIADFNLYSFIGQEVRGSDITKDHKKLLLWLEVSKEPTEHILNEIYNNIEAFRDIEASLIFIIKSQEDLKNETLNKVVKSLPGVNIYLDDFEENINTLSRRMYIDGENLPMIIITEGSLKGIAAFSGYNVGLTETLLKIMKYGDRHMSYDL